jgi:predicted enzyme related to lactoylglutathione lyase
MANNIDYFEIGTADPSASRAFYGGLFGWPIGAPSEPSQYASVDNDSGGLWDTSGTGGENWAIFYVHVEDVKATIARAEELGAKVAVPYVGEGDIEFAHLVDPLGNRFGVYRPKSG